MTAKGKVRYTLAGKLPLVRRGLSLDTDEALRDAHQALPASAHLPPAERAPGPPPHANHAPIYNFHSTPARRSSGDKLLVLRSPMAEALVQVIEGRAHSSGRDSSL